MSVNANERHQSPLALLVHRGHTAHSTRQPAKQGIPRRTPGMPARLVAAQNSTSLKDLTPFSTPEQEEPKQTSMLLLCGARAAHYCVAKAQHACMAHEHPSMHHRHSLVPGPRCSLFSTSSMQLHYDASSKDCCAACRTRTVRPHHTGDCQRHSAQRQHGRRQLDQQCAS